MIARNCFIYNSEFYEIGSIWYLSTGRITVAMQQIRYKMYIIRCLFLVEEPINSYLCIGHALVAAIEAHKQIFKYLNDNLR